MKKISLPVVFAVAVAAIEVGRLLPQPKAAEASIASPTWTGDNGYVVTENNEGDSIVVWRVSTGRVVQATRFTMTWDATKKASVVTTYPAEVLDTKGSK